VRGEDPQHEPNPWPPGEYVDEDQQAATKRFIEEARTLAARRVRGMLDWLDDERSGDE